MNTEDDHDIKSFFDDMRKKDAQQSITDFEVMLPKKKTSKLRYIIPASIAACLSIGVGIWTGNTEVITEPENTLFITLEGGEHEAMFTIILENARSEEIIQENHSIYEWESDTSFLIKDFND